MNLKNLLKEPTDKPVEDSKSVSWFNITLIKVGVFISLPGFVTGVKIGNQVGYYDSVLAFFSAGIVLGLLASITGIVGAKTKLSTYIITQYAFGKKGASLINLIFAMSLFGWFGINTALFGSALASSLGDQSSFGEGLYSVVGGALMIATAIFGFKALDKMSQLAVPLLCIGLIVLVYVSLTEMGFAKVVEYQPESMALGNAISAVIGGSVVGTVIFPDICRYARSYKHAIIAAIITFSIAKPLILLSSAVPSLATGLHDIMDILNALNLGIIALAVIIFTTWTSNNGNLYGASLSLSSVFSQFSYWQLVLISGVLGTIFAITGVTEFFIPFLQLLGITIPPVAGIFIVHFYLISGQKYELSVIENNNNSVSGTAVVAWLAACIIGFLSLHQFITLTTVPALDSLISAGVIFYFLKKVYSALTLPDVNKTSS